ncbi:MAG: hypothetical protein U0175_13855 [Caldilineaceae bacterium]
MSTLSLELDSQEFASRIKLSYCSDQEQGFKRKRRGQGFAYYDGQGKLITDATARKRIQSLVIPPAWDEVWISTRADTHIQATGRDEKGRKQYIYHPDWESTRNLAKYESLLEFGQALPKIRQQVECDLRKRQLTHQKVVAIALYMLDKTLVRIGNSQYASSNKTYGLTTLRKRHVKMGESALVLSFVGKSGKKHNLSIEDKKLLRLIKSCQELPGQQLFQYYDEEGKRQALQSADINNYLHEITGSSFSAKYFRTWGGTVIAIETLLALGPSDEAKIIKKNLKLAICEASNALGNTTSVCRNYYVHPVVAQSYEDGTLFTIADKCAQEKEDEESFCSFPETVALALLEQKLPA